MKIFGVSQSSGVERRLYVERGHDGIVLIIKDHLGSKERERILVQADDLLSTITDRAPGGRTVDGVSPAHGWKMVLQVEVRGKEVWLKMRPPSGEGADVAVGLDDFQDALEGPSTAGDRRPDATRAPLEIHGPDLRPPPLARLDPHARRRRDQACPPGILCVPRLCRHNRGLKHSAS
jgi:hypothetical protein